MAQALVLDSRDIALDLYDLLRELDPVRWRSSLQHSTQERVDALEKAMAEMEARWAALDATHARDEALLKLRASFERLAQDMREHLPAEGETAAEMRRQWRTFRKNVHPSYEEFAASLRKLQVQVPSYRPTNLPRTLFHAGSAILSLVIVELALGPVSLMVVAGAVFLAAWTMEITRRYSKLSDRFSWFIFGKMAHPTERTRVNSATWYATALFTLSLTGEPLVGALALAILGIADPSAALAGRRWGRHRIANGRTLEGSLAFVLTGLIASLATMLLWHRDLGVGPMILVSLGTVLPAAAAELWARWIDDNLLVPLAAAAGAVLTGTLLGVM